MRFLHSMVRVRNLDESLKFYCEILGLSIVKKTEYEQGRFTLVFLATKEDIQNFDKPPMLELTYNWPDDEGKTEHYQGGRNFGHIAFEVDDIYQFCSKLVEQGVILNRPPRDGKMAFIKSPDGISIEILQKGNALDIKAPWYSMENIGTW